jgi:hypothetical protein
MRFRYIDFTENFAKRECLEKVTPARICVALVALFVWLCPLTAGAQARRINGYAVQVAALTSRGSADALARGLSARGMNAYLVGGASYGAARSAALYRVRIGNFQTIASANSYAEKNLLGAGLIEAYAITAYESPSKGGSIVGSNWKIQTFAQKRPQKYPGRQFETDLIDVVATIGSRGWLLLSSESINLTVRTGNSALSRELVALVDAIGSRGWGLNDNVTKFLGATAPIKVVSLPSDILTSGTGRAGAPPAITTAGSYSAAAPEIGRAEIGRGGLGPTTSTSRRIGGPSPGGYGPPPRLQGALEMRGGRMFMTLRNVDTDRVFSGVARISLTDDQKQEDVTPINVTLLPDKETSFPLDDATLTNGAWVLMVYDLNGVARMIRGASFTPPKKPAQAPDPSDPTEPAPAPEAPPSYVTGVYDTTNWTQPQVSPQAEAQAAATSAPTTTQDDTSVVEGAPAALNSPPQANNEPGTVTASLRQIAVTSENVTLELAISAQNPLKNVTVVLRAGDFQDVRQAFIPNTQGRVPFLVPAKFASAGLYYEVKDEAQRLLTNGNASLGNLSK